MSSSRRLSVVASLPVAGPAFKSEQLTAWLAAGRRRSSLPPGWARPMSTAQWGPSGLQADGATLPPMATTPRTPQRPPGLLVSTLVHPVRRADDARLTHRLRRSVTEVAA